MTKKRSGRGTSGATPTPAPGAAPGGAAPQPVKWGSIDLSAIASRLGLPRDADMQAVVANLARKGNTPADIAAFVLDGQKALDFIDNYTPTNSTVDPNTPASAVDLDDADPDTAVNRLSPDEVEAYFGAAVRGAGSGAARDVRLRGGGVSIQGTFRRPTPEGPEADAATAAPPGSKRQRKAPDPKPGDPGYFAFQDAQADRKWQERGRNPPLGTGAVRWAKRNPEAAALIGLGIGGAGYGIGQALQGAMSGQPQEQPQGRFKREGDDQLLRELQGEMGLPAGAQPGGNQTMQPQPNDAASLLMRIRQSRSI